jgi:hypothetical protein
VADQDLPEPEDAPEVSDDAPEATVDKDVPRAPGGADASAMESDVGSGESADLLTPDQPLAAQTDEVEIPDAIQEGEDTDTDGDTAGVDEDGDDSSTDPEKSKSD